MYKKTEQLSQAEFGDFNQSCGIALNKDDEWVRIADSFDWNSVEREYMDLFKSGRGRPAVAARIALGALIIQKRMRLSDRELVKEIARNPYYQYFLGLPKYQKTCPFRRGVLSQLRKRFGLDILKRINEAFLRCANSTREHSGEKRERARANGNAGTMILDATCSPQNIRFPQDYSLLNEAREKLDAMIDDLHRRAGDPDRPRTHRRSLRKEYLSVARSKKPSNKKIRSLLRKLLASVKRNLGIVMRYKDSGLTLSRYFEGLLPTISAVLGQQEEMFRAKTHRVADRIVSIPQPFIRPIVRGKKRTAVEFGAKYDVSIDENGHARLEKISFDAYNESSVLIGAIENYKERAGHYPRRVLVDQIYRTRSNRSYCEARGIAMQGKKGGQPPKDKLKRRRERRRLQKDEIERIEVERFFSVDKRKFGAGLIMTKLEETTLGSIMLSIFVANLFETSSVFFVFSFICAHFRERFQRIESRNAA